MPGVHAMSDYVTFLARKAQLDGDFGFEPITMPDALFDFQQALVAWAVRKGRAAILADCGLGKTLMELAWADNVARHTGKPVLILTPLAVAQQFEQEAHRFRFDAAHSRRGEIDTPIVIANYERLHLFDTDRFGGIVCDESSILKSFDGMRRREITEAMRTKQYRLLSTATAAPNDFIELGTSSEALGYLGHMDMLARFFVNDQNTMRPVKGRFRTEGNWRFKGHAEQPFWRWVGSWARAMRKPSDPLIVNEHVIEARTAAPGMLFAVPANGLFEERQERRRTIEERCEMVADLVNDTGQPAVVWCHLNDEGDLLERLIPDANQVSGKDTDERKEATFDAFASGELRVLVTKPKIGAWGLNWQHCNHLTYFPSHSYEQYYQAVRRCWRFGQTRPVTVDIVATEGEVNVQHSLQRKSEQADQMFTELVAHMTDAMSVRRINDYTTPVEVPSWLKAS
jgi:hypothetical protein